MPFFSVFGGFTGVRVCCARGLLGHLGLLGSFFGLIFRGGFGEVHEWLIGLCKVEMGGSRCGVRGGLMVIGFLGSIWRGNVTKLECRWILKMI